MRIPFVRRIPVTRLGPLLVASLGTVLHAAPPDWLLDASGYTATVTSSKTGVVLQNCLVRRTFRISPNAVTVGLDHLGTGTSFVRAVEPEAVLTIDGRELAVGGLKGQPDRAYLLPEWTSSLTNDPAALVFIGMSTGNPEAPVPWTSKRHHADIPWPPPGMSLDLRFRGPEGPNRNLFVTVHHELYDGLPVFGKWLTVSNGSPREIVIDRFTSEQLAVVEAESAVDERPNIAWRTPAIDVLSDYMFKGMDVVTGNQTATWQPDPAFTTQVSYALHTPCILRVQPPVGPGKHLAPGESFTTFRSYLVLHDSTERERQGLTLRHATRALAPWTTENPIMMHVRSAETKAFRQAVDQCVEVGFEMIIYTFGSGLEMEKDDPAYMARVKSDVEYAHGMGGWGYSNLQMHISLLNEHKINLLLQGALERFSKLPDVPTPFEFAKTEEDREVLALFYSQQTVARPVLSPPGLPSDRLAALRAAFLTMGKDEEFRKDAEKVHLDIDMTSNEAIEKVVNTISSTPPKIVERFAKINAPPEKN